MTTESDTRTEVLTDSPLDAHSLAANLWPDVAEVIRADERERLAGMLLRRAERMRGGSDVGAFVGHELREVARWLRSGGKEPGK